LVELRRPEPLDTGKHHRDRFDCGVEEFNTGLRLYAGQNRRRNTAATWVMTDIDHQVVVHATLSMSAVDIGAAPADLRKGAPAQIPVLLLGRLAVDQRYRGYGAGTAMVRHVLMTAVELNAKAACRAVVVNAFDEDARSWWIRTGFAPFGDDHDDSGYRDLYLLSRDVEALMRAEPDLF
jgi:GNAT superfamily N-acetyltransferase